MIRTTWPSFRALLGIAGLLSAGSARAAEPATLTIRVEDVLAAGGILRLGLYDAARYPDDDSRPVASADVAAVADATVITLHAPPGTYAIQTFQDVNGNDKMDTSWLGIPLEPFGFSRDAKPFLSKPDFDEVKFVLAPGENSLTLHLQTMSRNSPTTRARDSIRARQRK